METTGRAWRLYLAFGLVLAAAHTLPGYTVGTSYAFVAIAITGPVAMAIGIRRRSQRRAWLYLLIGTSLMVAGDVLWTWYDAIAGIDPFPSLADALYLPGYPCIAAGLLWMLRDLERGSERESLIDATIIATGCGVVSWMFLVAPYVRDSELTLAERAVSSAYPLMGILLIAVVARLGFARRSARLGDLLIGIGLGALLVADTYLGVIELTVGYQWNPVAEFLWLAAYVLFGAAALTPESSTVADPRAVAAEQVSEWTPRMRLPLLTLASLMAPAVLAYNAVQGRNVDLFVIAVSSTLLFLLVLSRVFGLVRRVEEQASKVALLAASDALTGLANRRHWDDEIERLLSTAARTDQPICVAMIDLDNFKDFNDAHGHYAGDTLLRDCARAWRDQLRATDVLARIGGEEFALALPSCTVERAVEVIDRLRADLPGNETFSCGLAVWDGIETDEALLMRADMALYAAKASGRDRTVPADPPSHDDGASTLPDGLTRSAT